LLTGFIVVSVFALQFRFNMPICFFSSIISHINHLLLSRYYIYIYCVTSAENRNSLTRRDVLYLVTAQQTVTQQWNTKRHASVTIVIQATIKELWEAVFSVSPCRGSING
jgi:hypothetical protein